MNDQLSYADLEAMRLDCIADRDDIAKSIAWITAEQRKLERQAETERPKRQWTRLTTEQAYLYIRDHKWCTLQEMISDLGVAENTVRRKLRNLSAAGRITSSPTPGTHTRYHIVKPGVPVETPKPLPPKGRGRLTLVDSSSVPGTARRHTRHNATRARRHTRGFYKRG